MDSPQKLAKEGWQPLPSCKFDWEITPLLSLESKDTLNKTKPRVVPPLVKEQSKGLTLCPPPSPKFKKKRRNNFIDRVISFFRSG